MRRGLDFQASSTPNPVLRQPRRLEIENAFAGVPSEPEPQAPQSVHRQQRWRYHRNSPFPKAETRRPPQSGGGSWRFLGLLCGFCRKLCEAVSWRAMPAGVSVLLVWGFPGDHLGPLVLFRKNHTFFLCFEERRFCCVMSSGVETVVRGLAPGFGRLKSPLRGFLSHSANVK